MLKILNNDKFTTAQNRHFLVSLKTPILNTLPVRAKVKANRSPILLPLQGVGVYALIPRALPWAWNWLPFQGAPFRALFVYHVYMLCHLLSGSKPRRDFSEFWTPYLPPRKHKSQILHPNLSANAVPDSSVSYPRRDRLSSQTRTRLLPETNASGPTFAKRHRH